MIDRLRATWPTRPIALRPPVAAWRSWFLVLVCLASGGGILAFIGFGLAQSIIDDLRMRDRAQTVQMARIEGGRCSSRLALLHICDVTIIASTKDGQVRRSLTHAFVDLHVGGWTAQVMADPARPGVFTTDIGLDRIWHRLVSALALAGFGIALLFAPWRNLNRLSAERARITSLSGQPLTPVPLGIQSWQGQVVTLVDPRGTTHSWTVAAKTALFETGPGEVLGVTGPTGEAFPLDEKLRWAKLTDHERAALLQARPA